MFARFKDEENIKAVERLLNSHTELEMFERSQLGECPVSIRREDGWILEFTDWP